ncbi:DUF4202 domain-containing protein [Reyranella aquatilis]|uniref:DUF4202 domain-containing protein n=1 Tax=Reyranella aquatilis TaxID=2035356 RepID=A0ABS8KN01_9HYPH|nr:DUF4202 domain-containing protein [Reyranella aquatilis]MCC8427431.1 DUF4202 domain-containing protein [Reyranella aquatilis]
MTELSPHFDATIADIDAANAQDPRLDRVDGAARPREVVYSERMSDCMARLYPDASEALRLAARAQHICRWQIPRTDYPLGREGYNAWRTACREHHATLISGIMRRHGYADGDIAQVVKIIRKEQLKRDPESQALENVVAVVFVQHYLDEFIAGHRDYDDTKLAGILKKTLRKMDATGHAAALAANLPARTVRLIEMALK